MTVASPADIRIQSNVSNMNVTVNPGGSGCPTGQEWDTTLGRCTPAVAITTETSMDIRVVSCGAGYTGDQYQWKWCDRTVYGWRTPPLGTNKPSYYGAWSCGAWETYYSSCVAVTPPPSPPTSTSSTFTWSIFICGSGDDGYYSGDATNTYKNKIISEYQDVSYHGRCPESGGFNAYQSDLLYFAQKYQNQGNSKATALEKAWTDVAKQIYDNAIKNKEHLATYTSTVIDPMCNSEAKSRYGSSATGYYMRYSGNKCSYTK